MYKYELINNHYVVEINKRKYLIDTGSFKSFGVNKTIDDLVIDGRCYPLKAKRLDEMEIAKCIGVKVDGFIGLDIINQNGLTILKSGHLSFNVLEVDGMKLDLEMVPFLLINVECNGKKGKFMIDTGAKYGYGSKEIFEGEKPIDNVIDYNPTLGRLESAIYQKDIVLEDKKMFLDICDNKDVQKGILEPYHWLIVGNITTLFNEICVIDINKQTITFK